MSKHDSANTACPAQQCPDKNGVDFWSQAVSAGNVSTVGFVVGTVGLAAAPRSGSQPRMARAGRPRRPARRSGWDSGRFRSRASGDSSPRRAAGRRSPDLPHAIASWATTLTNSAPQHRAARVEAQELCPPHRVAAPADMAAPLDRRVVPAGWLLREAWRAPASRGPEERSRPALAAVGNHLPAAPRRPAAPLEPWVGPQGPAVRQPEASR